ncbi:prolipoprotein diacylglyceryl transferase [Terrihabitans sp. B22-R8]|uniref:prolipoprotein diacylglyceryl transferase n=1 Tax=Terrihabitans sp. B22-R8 TaxID=3425128 RepID=UPI00403CDE3A
MPILAIPFPMIDPVAVSIGPLDIRWYALAYVAGLLLGWWLATRLVRARDLWGREPPLGMAGVDDMLIFVAIGVIIGGRLGYVLVYHPGYYAAHPLEALMPWYGGMSFHGGLVGAGLALWPFARQKKTDPLGVFDIAAAVVPVGLFFGRLANFINGELWGRASDVPWAMVFPGAGPEPRHPSQLYQAALEGVLLFAIVMLVVKLGGLKRPGMVTGTFLGGYAIFRIIGETFRQPDTQLGFLAGGMTMGMLLSLPMLALGLVLLVRARRPAAA